MRREGSGGFQGGEDWARRRSDEPPVEGYTWPEFAVEVLRLVRRLASLPTGRLDPIEVVARWLEQDGEWEGRSRPDQWRDSQRAHR